MYRTIDKTILVYVNCRPLQESRRREWVPAGASRELPERAPVRLPIAHR